MSNRISTSLYRVVTTGDGTAVNEVEGTWDDLVRVVSWLMYCDPTIKDEARVRDMLENGLDGGHGWDGDSVTLMFEDGSLTVEYINKVPPEEIPL